MTDDHHKEIKAAANALLDWFKSQDISPATSVSVLELFIARMILQNSKSADDIDRKISKVTEHLQAHIAVSILEGLWKR